MSTYITELKKATTLVHEDDFKTILRKIKTEAADWIGILWNKEQLSDSLNETVSKNARIIAIAVCKYMTEE